MGETRYECKLKEVMSVDESALGGRLPLFDSDALNPSQKELYYWLMDVAVPGRKPRVSGQY